MKQIYKVQGKTLGGYECVSINDYDKCISGPKGEIWQVNENTFKALLFKRKREVLVSFNIKDLRRMISAINGFQKPVDMLVWANHPNARFDAK